MAGISCAKRRVTQLTLDGLKQIKPVHHGKIWDILSTLILSRQSGAVRSKVLRPMVLLGYHYYKLFSAPYVRRAPGRRGPKPFCEAPSPVQAGRWLEAENAERLGFFRWCFIVMGEWIDYFDGYGWLSVKVIDREWSSFLVMMVHDSTLVNVACLLSYKHWNKGRALLARPGTDRSEADVVVWVNNNHHHHHQHQHHHHHHQQW